MANNERGSGEYMQNQKEKDLHYEVVSAHDYDMIDYLNFSFKDIKTKKEKSSDIAAKEKDPVQKQYLEYLQILRSFLYDRKKFEQKISKLSREELSALDAECNRVLRNLSTHIEAGLHELETWKNDFDERVDYNKYLDLPPVVSDYGHYSLEDAEGTVISIEQMLTIRRYAHFVVELLGEIRKNEDNSEKQVSNVQDIETKFDDKLKELAGRSFVVSYNMERIAGESQSHDSREQWWFALPHKDIASVVHNDAERKLLVWYLDKWIPYEQILKVKSRTQEKIPAKPAAPVFTQKEVEDLTKSAYEGGRKGIIDLLGVIGYDSRLGQQWESIIHPE
jgi:hypothetical protein